MNLVLDAMGGDFAPGHEVEGALMALRSAPGRFTIDLVGQPEAIRAELDRLGVAGDPPFGIVPASQVVTMHDHPAQAVKSKPDSSLVVGLKHHAEGKADAFVSTGNTGAVMTASVFILGRLPGVSRPTVFTFFPTVTGSNVLIVDAGANVDSKPEHLVQFAQMGAIYAGCMFGKSSPRVGLLNVGSEPGKGTELAKEAHALLTDRPGLNFIGNIEGRDLLRGKADVAVCDGFTGNILLKFAETIEPFVAYALAAQLPEAGFDDASAGRVQGALRQACRGFDYETQGGVPLLGVGGVSLIGHGEASPMAIQNMLIRAEEMVRLRINDQIRTALQPAAAPPPPTAP